jgi:shikimate dehydrogenase
MVQSCFGIIGFPLQQSFSQVYFRQKFADLNIAADYLKFEITDIALLPSILLQNPNLKGLNVTSPYKEQVLQYVQRQSTAVQQIGAANTLSITNGSITAYNTDVIGLEQSLQPLLQKHHTKALILGTGGAAKAAAYVLQQLNIDFLFVSRSNKNGTNTITYNAIDAIILQQYLLIINCSPSGMVPNQHTFPPLPYQFITPQHLVYDMVYKPEETIFLQKAKQQGATIKNGFAMLQLQAEASWKIWTAQETLNK